MDTNKPKLLFLTQDDPLDKKAWSGTLYHMHHQLSKYFEVTNTGPIPHLTGFWKLAFNVFASINHRVFHKYYDINHSKLIGRLNLKKIKDKVYGDYDFIYAPIASRELSQVKNLKTPVIYASDITFDLIKEKYGFEMLYKFSFKEGDDVERLAIKKATYCLYPSEWAANSAINKYSAKPEKVLIIPLGANISHLPEYDVTAKTNFNTLEILFLGVDWVRKGGDIVLNTYRKLKEHNFDVHLTICGCVPPVDLTDSDITVISFLDKNNPKDYEKFNQLLIDTHLLFVPSEAEAYGIVFCEAAAYGIPVITRDVGGISSIVKNNVNGYCLPYDSTLDAYFETLSTIVTNNELYKTLSTASRKLYSDSLSWDRWGEKVSNIMKDHLRNLLTQNGQFKLLDTTQKNQTTLEFYKQQLGDRETQIKLGYLTDGLLITLDITNPKTPGHNAEQVEYFY
ncbi:glycosyltransferase, partial [bacterium]